jgi:hypothetical protein
MSLRDSTVLIWNDESYVIDFLIIQAFIPRTLNIRQKRSAQNIKDRFQSSVSTIADSPRNIKMMVSLMLASIFIK